MKKLLNSFMVLLPLLLTLVIVSWIVITLESVFSFVILLFIPERWYFTGLGVTSGFLLFLLLSILIRAWVFKTLHDWFTALIQKIPIVRPIYASIKSITDLFSGAEAKKLGAAVLVEWNGLKAIGIVCAESPEQFDSEIPADENLVGVYLPMSYQVGGYMVFVPRESITPLNMKTEKALGLILTAGLSSENNKESQSSNESSNG